MISKMEKELVGMKAWISFCNFKESDQNEQTVQYKYSFCKVFLVPKMKILKVV